jgi:F-type H+-transporting ATPase subunit delta
MAENSTIARPYAEALFSAAKDSADSLQGTANHLQLLAELIEMEDVRQAVSDPRLDDAQRCDLVKGLLKGVKLDAHLDNFIELVVSNDRLLLMPEIAEQFQALKDKAEGVAQADIVSAFPMSDAQVSELVQLLEPKFNLKLKPHVTVDETLIGGVRVVVGDYVLDTSVQAQLNRMRDALVA